MVNYLNYGISKTFSLLLQQFKLSSFLSILISCVLFGFIIFLNKEKKTTKYIFIGLNISFIILILYLYFEGIMSFKYSHPFKNIYVYYLNSIIYLILITILSKRIIHSKLGILFYIFNLIGIFYSIYITIYLKNITIIVIGNIFPEIFFGNILIFINYIYMIIRKTINNRSKKNE